MMRTPTEVCILGGGFGGLFTALSLSQSQWRRSPPAQITLVDPHDHFLFTPLLYELVTAELQRWHIAPKFRKLLAGTGIVHEPDLAKGINFDQRQVYLESGKVLPYDYLVLAVGNESILPTIAGAVEFAYPFYTLADVNRLDEQLQRLERSQRQDLQVAIVGSGPSGVELAGKVVDRLGSLAQLTLISRSHQILKDFSRFSQTTAEKALVKRGVHLRLATEVMAVQADRLILCSQEGGEPEFLRTDLVIWAAGNRTKSWISRLPTHHAEQQKILIRPTLQLLDRPEVFALGDLAAIQGSDRQPVPETAQAAFQQARIAAYNLQASLTGKPLLAFRYHHLGEMMTLGTNNSLVSGFSLKFEGALGQVVRQWAYWPRLPTHRHRFQVAIHWLLSPLQQALSCLRQKSRRKVPRERS